MKKKLILRSAVLVIMALFLVLPFAVTLSARAFFYDYLDDDNNIVFSASYKNAPDASGWKYAGGDWYFFFEKTGGATKDLNAVYYRNNGFVVPILSMENGPTDPVTGIYTTTHTADAKSIFTSIINKQGYDWLHANGGSIQVYANRVFYAYKAPSENKKQYGPCYDYDEFYELPRTISNWMGYWSGNVLKAVKSCYDVPVSINFKGVPFTTEVVGVDAKGNVVDSALSYTGDLGFDHPTVFYSEPITVNNPGTIADYKYLRWELKAGDTVIKSGTSADASFVPKYAEVQNKALTLTFIYQEVAVEMPFSSPTPEPTRAPGATATPTPKPTNTPTPAPPTPTSQPTGHTVDWKTKDWYFTTDQGYYVEKIVGSSTSKLAAQGGVDALTLPSASQTSRDNNYSVGTDSNGNEWYFMINGSDAILVHPRTYNGYSADSTDIKYITELVFPSTLTILYGTTQYTVRSIGGGTGYYKPERYSTGSGNTYYDYGAISGYYSYNQSNDTSSQYTSIDHYVSYAYGVLGNASIQSQGSQYYYYYISEGSKDLDYDQNYYFYNTTLKKIVIPSTVTTIEECAFMNCQALETIEGGANVTYIGQSAFSVTGEPKLKLSSSYSVDKEKYSLYYYYNEEASTTTYTARMLAWRDASFLCDEMIFPYLPRLTHIGGSAFSQHHNIDEVDLSATVSRIDNYAFNGCKLDRIRIPNASCDIYNSSSTASQNIATLGTKGYDLSGNTTEIHCAPDSTAMNYGLMHDGYYVLYCGHPVTYHPNGAPGSTQEIYSALNIHYGEVDDTTGTRLTYPNYKAGMYDSYYYSPSACQYQSYLDKDGVMWLLDTTNKTMSVVSPGTTFTEMFREDAAIFAYDSAGNLWVSGQQAGRSVYTDSWGDLSYYTYYSDWFNWRKVSFPSGTVKKQITPYGVFCLDSNGVIWWSQLSGGTRQMSYDSPAFVDFCFASYGGNVEENINSYMACLGADGTLYYARDTYYSDGEEYYTTGFTLGAYLYADNWNSVATTDGVQVAVFYENHGWSSSVHHVVLNASGALKLYTGTSLKQTISSYNFTDMEAYTVFGKSGAKLYDAAGNTYFLGYSGNYNTPMRLMKVADAGVGIREIWSSSHTFSSSSNYGCDYDSYDQYSHNRMYVWTDDGYLYAHSDQTTYYDPDYGSGTSTYQACKSWRVADAKFKKVVHNSSYDCLFAIAEDGTLWSGGRNEYGQLGDNNQSGYSYGYEYPASNTSFYLTKTSSRTYTDVYPYAQAWAIALGTDGKVYFSGYKPLTSYGNGYYNDVQVNSFTALGSEYSWPSGSSVPRLRTGFDYNTVIVSNPFTYPNYEFKGWNTVAGGTGTAYMPGDAVELTGAITLYAQWGKTNNIIRYDRNGGSGTMASTVLDYDTTTTTLSPNRFAKEGYSFAGWNTYANGTGTSYADGASITVGKGTTTTLYAQWREIVTTYTLVYMKYPYGTSGNTAWKSKSLSYRTVETVEGQPYTPSGAYTVTYNINKPAGMSSVPSALAKTSDSTPAPSFSKWRLYTKNTSGEYVYGGRQYAKGETLSQLTKENGGVVYLYPSWQTTGSYVVLPYTEADGYVFDGWNETADGSGALYPVYPPEDSENVGLYTPSKSTTLYGTWTPLTKTLALDATNKAAAAAGMSATVSNPQASVEVTFDAVAPNAKAPSCSRWVFMGYYTKLDAAGNPTADSVKVYDTNRNADGTYATYTRGVTAMNNVNGTFDTISTLYAFWVPDKAVSYEPNYSPVDAACPSMETTWVDFDKDYVDLPANKFTKTGYHFTNWNTKANNSGTSYADKGRVTGITGRLTLYAQWAPNKYSVTLSQPDATTQGTTAVTATYDAAMPSVIIPKREYTVSFNANTGTCATTSLISKYTFGGYYTGTGGSGIQYYKADGTSARIWDITQNTTLYAKWTSVSVTLPAAEKRGYDFLGWYTEAVNGTKIGDAGNTYTPTAGITLYAHWKAKEFDITLNDRGATSTNHTGTVHMTYDQKGASVTVPTKTGYTFHGYYTGTHGTGTRYYDASGVCVKEWTEVDVTQIYAYWTQNDVLLPEVGDRTEPTPLPELEAEGSVGRSDPKGLLYADDYNDATDALTDLQPYLTYDAGTSEGAIPGTEKIAFRAKMGSWMLHYKLHRNTGTDYVRFYVTVPYRTQYEQSADEELVISEQQKKTYTFVVPKVWSYWEILESGMYYPDKVTVTNSATKDTSFTVNVNRAGSFAIVPPAYDVEQYGDKTTHVFWDEYDTDAYPILRITLTEEQYIISDVRDTLPDVDAYLARVCGNAAWLDTRQATVRNDRFILDGQSILSDIENKTGNGTELCPDVLEYYTSDGAIEETSYLQTYQPGIELNETIPNGCYVTSAEITYVGVSENIGSPATETVQLKDINNLKIHTPVACSGRMADGMETTEEGYVLILQDALNFFTLSIDNTGIHRMNPGYGEKNFNRALSGKSNVAEQDGKQLNQVCFPFDVYVDVGNDSKISDGCCSPEGDYLLQAGIWLTLGLEEQSFYVPVTMKNGKYQIKFRSVAVNCPRDENGQYIFGEEEYLVNLSPSCYVAADAINVEVRSYLRDFRITFVNDPLAAEQLEKGCQALTLKKGYGFFFELLSQGEFYGKNAEISIVPSYFFESEDGAERKEVKLFRLEKLPENGGKNCYAWEGEPILLNHENYEVIKQRFCGNGMVPENVLCVEKNYPLEEYAGQTTFTGKEDFFLQNGFLIIRFDIIVKSNEGVPYVFNAWENTMLAEHAKQQGWNFIPGDVIRYDLTKCISDDYEIGGSE